MPSYSFRRSEVVSDVEPDCPSGIYREEEADEDERHLRSFAQLGPAIPDQQPDYERDKNEGRDKLEHTSTMTDSGDLRARA